MSKEPIMGYHGSNVEILCLLLYFYSFLNKKVILAGEDSARVNISNELIEEKKLRLPFTSRLAEFSTKNLNTYPI